MISNDHNDLFPESRKRNSTTCVRFTRNTYVPVGRYLFLSISRTYPFASCCRYVRRNSLEEAVCVRVGVRFDYGRFWYQMPGYPLFVPPISTAVEHSGAPIRYDGAPIRNFTDPTGNFEAHIRSLLVNANMTRIHPDPITINITITITITTLVAEQGYSDSQAMRDSANQDDHAKVWYGVSPRERSGANTKA